MTDPRFSRLMNLVEAAVACAPAEGDELLIRECGDDLELLAEARELVALARTQADDGLTEVLHQGVEVAAGNAMGSAATPETIGPFRILEKLGEGGMGSVFLARQDAPMRRDVALKVIRSGFADSRIIARFDAERQALASLEHPGIARVYDAGATETGVPYIAMEHVRGEPITAYCDSHKLGFEERLSLFIQVCRAIQHAHFNGIIHRDIKPSNVLVTTIDAEPIVKVIDFGIAKFIGNLSDEEVQTQFGAMLGTLGYMSPEQAEGSGSIDTRTDVYSLGVLLYELVGGGLPFDSASLRGLSPAEIRKVLSSTDPAPPSVRLSDRDDAEDIARKRSSDVKALRRNLRGDADWVVMKALEREPDHRYATAFELAAEVERILNHQPVIAAAPTLLTRAGKFYRRHRLPVTAAALIFIAITTGATLSTIGFLRAAEEQRIADHEATVATRTSRFLTEALAAARPAEEQGGETTVREILDLATARLAQQPDIMPEVEARLRYVIGTTYASLAVYDRALDQLGQASALLEQSGGASAEQAAQALSTLSDVLQRRGRYYMAQMVNLQLLTLEEETHGPMSVEYAAVLLRVGRTFASVGSLDDAKAKLLEAKELRRQLDLPPAQDPLGAPLQELEAAIAALNLSK